MSIHITAPSIFLAILCLMGCDRGEPDPAISVTDLELDLRVIRTRGSINQEEFEQILNGHRLELNDCLQSTLTDASLTVVRLESLLELQLEMTGMVSRITRNPIESPMPNLVSCITASLSQFEYPQRETPSEATLLLEVVPR